LGAASLLSAVVLVAVVDAVRRGNSASTLAISTANPPREVIRAAEWDLNYLVGFFPGVATGVAAVLAVALWRSVLIARRGKAAPNLPLQQTAASKVASGLGVPEGRGC
jgi:hypothetical protein